jgi:hypothetical protein
LDPPNFRKLLFGGNERYQRLVVGKNGKFSPERSFSPKPNLDLPTSFATCSASPGVSGQAFISSVAQDRTVNQDAAEILKCLENDSIK